jgi:uncharacterized GH25 family protein
MWHFVAGRCNGELRDNGSAMHTLRTPAVVLAIFAAATVSLVAHDIGVFPRVDAAGIRLEVKYGHPGDYTETFASRLIDLQAIAPNGTTQPLAGRLRPEQTSLLSTPMETVAAGVWMFSAFYDNGFYLRTTDGRTVNTTKAEYPAAQSVTHNLKYGKSLLQVGSEATGFDRVLGHPLELIPQSNPFQRTGKPLSVAVRLQGKPLPGVSMTFYPLSGSGKPMLLKTDAAGIAQVDTSESGTYILSVEHGVPSRHPEMAMRDAYAASLVFTLK